MCFSGVVSSGDTSNANKNSKIFTSDRARKKPEVGIWRRAIYKAGLEHNFIPDNARASSTKSIGNSNEK